MPKHLANLGFPTISSLALVLLWVVFVPHSRAQDAPPIEGERAARDSFRTGKSLFDKGQFEDALSFFADSLQQFPSPNTQIMIAETVRRLGRLDEAALAYEKAMLLAMQHTPPETYAQARARAQLELQKLWKETGRIQLVVDSEKTLLRVIVGERELGPLQIDRAWPVMPGPVQVVAEFADRPPWTKTVQVAAGIQTNVHIAAPELLPDGPAKSALDQRRGFDMEKHTAPEQLDLAPAGWASLGIAGAGVATFGIFYGLARGEYDTYEQLCVARPCGDEERQRLIEPGRSYNTVAKAGLITGAVSAAAALVFFLLDPSAPDEGARVQLGKEHTELTWSF